MDIFAVHLADDVLRTPFWVAGWPITGLLVAWSAYKLQDDELARLGVLTAAFFVASQVHLPLGGVSVHLLLNGLVGLILRRRAPLAIVVGLFLQVLLFGHGGWSTLGLNISIYTLPAVLAGMVFPLLLNWKLLHRSIIRRGIVLVLASSWLMLALFATQWTLHKIWPSPEPPNWWVLHPLGIGSLLVVSFVTCWLEPRLEKSPVFPLGLLLGAFAGFGTVGLNVLTLVLGCKPEFQALPGVVLLVHLPIIVLESLVLGFVLVYLHRAKPEWLTV